MEGTPYKMSQTRLITQELKDVLNNEINPEKMSSLERVDLICAYIQRAGLNELTPFFWALATREPPVPIRILTTSQLSISQPEAIHELAFLPNIDVKVFKAQHPTFHAKGWLFVHQGHNPDVAIVGSSNISKSAMETGLEWNICTTAEPVITDFKKVFESYWLGKHPAFGEANVLDYNLQKCDWESLNELFSSEVEPRCTDITGKCGHFECQKLSRELSRLKQREDEIRNNFTGGRNEGSRKRSSPPSNNWNLPQRAQPQEPISLTRKAQLEYNNFFPDSMEIDQKTQVGSTFNNQNRGIAADPLSTAPQDLHTKFYKAVLRNDVVAVRRTFEKAEGERILDSILHKVPESNLQAAINSKGTTPLDVYDLHEPLLFAIAYSNDPDIVKIIFKKGSFPNNFQFKERSYVTETILHVLARLKPPKACAILQRIRGLQSFRVLPLDDFNSPDHPLDIAKLSAQQLKPQDKSFIKILKGVSPSTRKPKFKFPDISPFSSKGKARSRGWSGGRRR
ncbi:MAG: hypothetical protein LQ351_007920 [Letrouitia transgressa]|nr:MAG: hypothetical protein LQ351_007920 [Letrouitia transgressa]